MNSISNARSTLPSGIFAALCIIVMALSLNGCVSGKYGLDGAITRAWAVEGDSYQQVHVRAGPIAANMARVWIYALDGGPVGMKTGGERELITFNRTIYCLGGKSFYYIDLPAGDCEITTTGIVSDKHYWKIRFQLGKLRKHANLLPQEEYYLRLWFDPGRPHAKGDVPFEFVDPSLAVQDMRSLKRWADTKTRNHLGKWLDESE